MSTTTTEIAWTDRTWNPVRGCSRVSPGCENCYAEKVAYRFSGPGRPFEGLARKVNGHAAWTGKVVTVDAALNEPLRWRKPARIFVNSMSDLFHEAVPWSFIELVFDVMREARQHTFQVLTKRADNMRQFAENWAFHHGGPLPNVWLGVSVEDQKRADERIPLLLQTPAAVRFISAEPLLGPVELLGSAWLDHECGDPPHRICPPALDWVIVGGESGAGARPFDLAWARSIVQQCEATGVPVFVKQLGQKPQYESTCKDEDPETDCECGPLTLGLNLRDRKGGDPKEWPADLRVREFPTGKGAA